MKITGSTRTTNFPYEQKGDSSALNSSTEAGFHHSLDFSHRSSNPLLFAGYRKSTDSDRMHESPTRLSDKARMIKTDELPSHERVEEEEQPHREEAEGAE